MANAGYDNTSLRHRMHNMLISWILNNVGEFGVIVINLFLFFVKITSMLYGTTK